MSTKKYWRGIEEINPSEEYLAKVKNEFEESSDVPFADVESIENATTSRRDFLKYLGFTTVAATLAASCEMPVRSALPYAIKPEDVTPGVPLHYASTFVDGGTAIPALVKVRDGRPIKIEGNTDSKLWEGATDARMQASVLNLYDAARLQAPLLGGEKASWKAVDDKVKVGLSGNVFLVTSTVNSPTGNDIINKFKAATGATHVQFDAKSYSGALDANEAAFGKRALPMYRFDLADTIVSLDADFLGTWGSSSLNTKQYSKGRKISAKNPKMSKHIQFEGVMSLSGMNSDERVVCRPSEIGAVAAALLGALDGGAVDLGNKYLDEKINMTVKALQGGSGLVVCGSNDKNIQTIVNAINSKIGAFGSTISTATTNNTKLGNDTDMDAFITALNSGGVDAVVFHDCNPVYEHPLGAKIAEKLKSVKLSVSLCDRKDETAAVCNIVAPTHHYLESWGDAEAFSGYVSFIQPTINNLFDTRQWQESLMSWSGEEGTWYDYFQNYWMGKLGGQKAFDEALQFGLMEPDEMSVSGSASASTGEAVDAVKALPKAKKDDIELVLYETVAIGAGGPWSNNPWLQEMPDPISKCTWDNYCMMSQNLAKKFNAEWTDLNEVERDKQVVTITAKNGQKVDVPVLVIPGMQENTIAVALGYGRGEGVGMAANNGKVVTGVKVSQLANATAEGINYSTTAKVESAGRTHELAVTQTHHSYQERPILYEYTLDEFKENPSHLADEREHHLSHYTAANGVNHHGDAHAGHAAGEEHETHGADKHHEEAGHGHGDDEKKYDDWQDAYRDNGTLYHMDQHPNHGIKWGMSIDLSSCTGCSACTIACQAENNVSVVGKERVLKVHDMHWIRIDRYFSGDVEDASSIQTVFQPMLCQHCDNAPCENVCPVNATNHSSEGINQMAYNRCIGTRYCANNCPYKVRRFNWRDFNGGDSFVHNLYEDGRRDDINNNVTRMVLNPDVTVRSRGVMEKCNFCVQKLQAAKRSARTEGRVMADGEAKTACQTACATGAITFGNVNDKSSEIYKLRNEEQKERVFYTLEEIHTLPNINYLSKIRNTDHVEGRAKGHEEEGHGNEHKQEKTHA